MKTLRKSREERSQSANELYAELGSVKLELDLEAHKERTRTGGSARHIGAAESPGVTGSKRLPSCPCRICPATRTTNTSRMA